MSRAASRQPCTAALLAAIGIVLAAGAVHAECLPGGIPRAAAARIDQSVLNILSPLVAAQVPPDFAIPNTPYTVFTCGGGFWDDTIVTPSGIVAHVTLRDVRLRFFEGEVLFDATVDVRMDGAIHLQICAAPDADCDMDATVAGAQVQARLAPSVQQCVTRLPITAFELRVAPGAADIKLSNCLYDDLWETVYEWFGTFIVDTLTSRIGDAVREELPPLLESFLTGIIADGFEYRKVRVGVAPSDIAISRGSAVITFDGDVRPIGEPPPSWCLNPKATLPDEPDVPVPAPDGDASVAIAISQPMIERAARATWLAGGLCYASTEFDLDLATPIDFLAPGVEVTGRLAVLDAPAVTLDGSSADGNVIVAAERVRADVSMQVPGHEATTLSAELGATLSGSVGIDPRLQSVVIDLSDARTSGAIVSAPGTLLAFSSGTLESVVKTSLLPALAQYRGRMALLGNLFVAAPVAARVDRVHVTPERVQADLELYPKDPSDRVPPVAELAQAPGSPTAPRFTVDLASTDDRTPTRFLRHRIEVDGVEDPEFRSGSRIVVAGLADGEHTVEVWAIDLQDNESVEPAAFTVTVDSVPPVVSLAGAPAGVLRGSSVRVSVEANDAITPRDALALRWIFSKVVGENRPDEVLSTGDVKPGDAIELDEIPEDVVVRLKVVATDEAGNEGEAEVSFFRNESPTMGGGCATSGPAALAIVPWLLAWRLRRRAGRCS